MTTEAMNLTYREVIDLINERTNLILAEIKEVKEHQKEQNGRVFKNSDAITVIKNNFKWIKGLAVMMIIPALHYIVQLLVWLVQSVQIIK